MTKKEYLQQANQLNLRIESHIKDREEILDMMTCLSSIQNGERVQSSPEQEARFVRYLEELTEIEEILESEIDMFVRLKKQMNEVLSGISDAQCQMALRYKYVYGYTGESLMDKMHTSRRTLYRWINAGLEEMELPENPVII